MKSITQNKKLFNFRPLLFIAFSFAMGILLAYALFYKKYILFSIASFVFLFVLLFYIAFSKDNFRFFGRILFSAICLIFSLLMALSFTTQLKAYNKATLENHYLTVDAKVKEVYKKDDFSKLVLTNVSVNGAIKTKTDYNMNIYVTGGSYDVGDLISFSGYIYDYKDTHRNSFSGSFLTEKIKFYAMVDSESISKKGVERNAFESVNCFIRDTLKQGMEEKEYQIAYSLLLGNSEVIDDEIISSFRNTGVAHIFAVSGLHIGFLAMALTFLFSKLKLNRVLSAILTISILSFYSGVCGFTPSSIRAVIMSSVLILSGIGGKKYDILSSLALAFCLILLYCPFELFTVGFQLSFCAVIGIALFCDKLVRLLKFMPSKLATPLATSLSAQIFTLPILLIYFEKVSFISVFINVLFIPIVSVVFIALFVLVIIGGAFAIPSITLFIPNYVIKGMRYAIDFCDRQFFLVYILVFLVPAIIYYSTFIVVSDLFNIKRLIKMILSCVLSIAFIVSTVILNVNEMSLAKITVTASNSFYSTVIENDDTTTVIVSKFNNSFYPSKLLKATDKETIDNLVILDSTATSQEIAYCVKQMQGYYTLDNVFVKDDEILLTALKVSLSGFNFYGIENGSSLNMSDVLITIFTDSCGVKICKNDKSVLVLSNLNKSMSLYEKLFGNYNLLVLTEDAINLTKKIMADEIITFGRTNSGYSALTDGSYIIQI